MEMSLPHASIRPNMHVTKMLSVNAKLTISAAGHLRRLWGDVCKNYHHLDFLCLNITNLCVQKIYIQRDQKPPLSYRVLKLSYTPSVRGVFILIGNSAWGGRPGFRLI